MKEKILRNKKNVLLGVLVVGVIAMTVAFAALATNLRISGTANTAATSWNIHFDNWTNVTENTVDGHSNTAEYNDNSISQTLQANVTKISNVNVTLKQPGDYVKYIFKIKNDGTIDAKLSNFTVTDTTSNTLVDYEVKCYDSETQDHVPTGNEITTNSVLSANGGLAYCYMQVKYKEQSQPSQTPGNNQVYNQASEVSTNIEATWTWVQAGNSNNNSGNSGNEQSGGNIQIDPTLGYDKFYIAGMGVGDEPLTELPGATKLWLQQDSSKYDDPDFDPVFDVDNYSKICIKPNNNAICVGLSDWDYDEMNKKVMNATTVSLINQLKTEVEGIVCEIEDHGNTYYDANIGDHFESVSCYIPDEYNSPHYISWNLSQTYDSIEINYDQDSCQIWGDGGEGC